MEKMLKELLPELKQNGTLKVKETLSTFII